MSPHTRSGTQADPVPQMPAPGCRVPASRPLTDEEKALPRDEHGRYTKYEITFAELQESDMEFLRERRNRPEIQRFMVVRDDISPEMQAAWFRSLVVSGRYALLWFRGERVGFTQMRPTDDPLYVSEGGIIIFEPEHRASLIPYRAAIAGMDWSFLGLGVEVVRTTILKSNLRAQRFARSLGHTFVDPDPAGEILNSWVDPERYFLAVEPLRALLRRDTEEHLARTASPPPGRDR